MLYIGLMSGTSMDAIDTALVELDGDGLSLLAYEQYPIADDIRASVRALDSDSPVHEVSRLDVQLGRMFADAALRILQQSGYKTTDISAIGSHGQTVLHLPDADEPRTLQIGDGNIIACKTGITTVADFRRMDLAAGGQGAPLAPAFHATHMRSRDRHRVILNIGGIANITILPPLAGGPVTGFDTGPGNGLLDDWNRRHRHTPMDHGAEWAASGQPDPALLGSLLKDPYFATCPPKSSGRDYFHLGWLDKQLRGNAVAAQDVQATLVHLSARTISDAITTHAPRTEEVFVCGGGVHNPLLMKILRHNLQGMTLASTGQLGVDPDAVEALTFAWLARCRLESEPGNLPSVTGAKRPVLLGAIYAAVENA